MNKQKINVPQGCKATIEIENGNSTIIIEEIQKEKAFIYLPDENGKMIKVYEGDEYFCVNKEGLHIIIYCLDIEDREENKHKWEDFATEKAAQQYVENNKKQFSIADIEKAIKNLGYAEWRSIDLIKELKIIDLKKCH